MNGSCQHDGLGLAGRKVAGAVALQLQQATDVEREVLRRLGVATMGVRKRAAAFSRQHFEHQLAGTPGMRIRDLAYALAVLAPDQRAWVLQPVFQAEQALTRTGPVLVEAAEVVTAAADLNAEVVAVVADGKVDLREAYRIRAKAAALVQEAGQVAEASMQAVAAEVAR